MTCTHYEKDLALYVEHDLADADAAAVEAHLWECATCPSFLAELRASQAWVKDLAAEEIDSEALAAMRVRTIVAAARARRSGPAGTVRAWALAACVILSVGAVVWVAVVSRTDRPRAVAVSSPPPSSAPRALATPVIAPPVIASGSPRSTLPVPSAVSPRMEHAHGRRGTDRPSVVPTLSPDDADQLARAVVAIARIRRVQDVEPDAEPSPAPTPLIRLATADPDVVIYWKLDPNGGE